MVNNALSDHFRGTWNNKIDKRKAESGNKESIRQVFGKSPFTK